jgi:hypothetical protein
MMKIPKINILWLVPTGSCVECVQRNKSFQTNVSNVAQFLEKETNNFGKEERDVGIIQNYPEEIHISLRTLTRHNLKNRTELAQRKRKFQVEL